MAVKRKATSRRATKRKATRRKATNRKATMRVATKRKAPGAAPASKRKKATKSGRIVTPTTVAGVRGKAVRKKKVTKKRKR